MLKAKVVIQVVDGDNVYEVGSRVRVLMKALTGHKSGYEYIGKIVDIQEQFMVVDTSADGCKIDTAVDYVVLHYKSINKMRFAKVGEDFMNTWNFDD